MTAPAPREHGGDGAAFAASLGVDPSAVLDLSASLNPVAPSVVPLFEDAARSLGRYPDDTEARQAIAAAVGVDAARVVVTNGGAEAIALVAAEYPNGRADLLDFGLYRRHLTDPADESGMRWRSNPHNPTGQLAADEHADVWDEAFHPLATGTWTRGDDDAIRLGSLTKVFACPGVRMGYVIARSDEEAARIGARRPGWSVSGPACHMIPRLLDDPPLTEWRDAVAGLREQLVDLLHGAGWQPEPSDVSYVWIPDAAGLRDALAEHLILVRSGASFGFPDAVRIAVPDEPGLEHLAAALVSVQRAD